MWYPKYDTNEPIYEQKQTQRHREQTSGCQGRGKLGVVDWEFEVSRCKLLHIDWMDNKVLLYSTGNYIQCPGINHTGKEYFLKMSICVKQSHFAVQQRLAQHCKSIILQLKKKKKKDRALVLEKEKLERKNWVSGNSEELVGC